MNFRKITAGVLAALTIATCAAGCAKKETTDDEAEHTEVLTNIFKGEFYSLPEEYSIDSRIVPLYDAEAGTLLCYASKYESWENEDGDYESAMLNKLFTVSPEGVQSEVEFTLPENNYVAGGIFADGDFIFLTQIYEDNSDSLAWAINRCDMKTGETSDGVPISGMFSNGMSDWLYIEAIAVDGDGDIYISADQEIVVLNVDFEKQFSVQSQNWINRMAVGADGVMYITGWMGEGFGISPIDKTTRSVGSAKTLPSNANDIWFGEGYDLYYAADSGVYGMNWDEQGKAGEGELVMSYLNSNVSRDSVELLGVIDAETILFSERTNDEDYTRAPALYKHAPDLDLSTVKVIEVAYGEWVSYQIPTKIVAFNKAHDDIRVVVKDYSIYSSPEDYGAGGTKLATDISTGLYKPDIVIGTSGEEYVAAVLRKQLYTDLTPYIEKDDTVNRSNLFGSVLSAFDDHGKMWGISDSFYANTLISTPELLGKYADQDSWTLDEVLDFAENLPDGVELMDVLHQESLSYRFLGQNGYAAFIDAEEATCSFDSPEFIHYLNFLRSLPKNYDEYEVKSDIAKVDWDERYQFYHDGKIALKDKYFSEINDFLNMELDFGTKDYKLIGYPTTGTSGTMVSVSNAYVITSFCSDPDAAWEVVKSFFESDVEMYNLPALKSSFDQLAETYYDYEFKFYYDGSAEWGTTDEEGEGSAMVVGEGGSSLDRPGIVTYFTPEDAARIKDFLDQPVTPLNAAVPEEVNAIINEEISALTAGSASPEDCAKRIQSRVGIYLAEHK